ncbi:tetratricopeptide repeat protein [Akkermansiaceae bacterium]|nr:tetratricopeptide repeat protein [Akkermansiaceae bacterium]
MPRPIILISAVGRELQCARYLAANTVSASGYQPEWRDQPPEAEGDAKAAIRKRVDRCYSVIQIIGHSYGPAPDEDDEEFGSISYTAYEALYAENKGKPVRYIILDASHPTDGGHYESEQFQKLQARYRAGIGKRSGLFQTSSSPQTTESVVRKICEEFSSLRRRNRRRTAALAALSVLTISGTAWGVLSRGKSGNPVHTAAPRHATAEIAPAGLANGAAGVISPANRMEKVLLGLADAESRSRIPGERLTLAEIRARAYSLLEAELGLTPGTLAESLPSYALDTYTSTGSSPVMRASAAYALNKFDEAEELFLREESRLSTDTEGAAGDASDFRTYRIRALEGAAQFATAQIMFARAVELYRAAAALTSLERDPLEWARIQHMLAYALTYNGQYPVVEQTLSQVIPVYEKHLGTEHPDTLGSSNNLANALNSQGKHAEAEKMHRAVLAIRLRTLGEEHPSTLTSRNNLAATLNSQGNHSDAEEQHRTVLAINQRIFGEEHPDTLFSRNNLAITLSAQRNFSGAAEQYGAILAIRLRLLGAEHPETLSCRDNLAKALRSQGNNAEAVRQIRAALTVRERLLGSDHHDVSLSCHNLALALANQGDTGEALAYARRALAGFTKSLGQDSPHSAASRKLVTILERH